METDKGNQKSEEENIPKNILHRVFDPTTARTFERLVANSRVSGNVFLDREDLQQEVFVTWLDIKRKYGDTPDLYKILTQAIKFHFRTLILDHVYNTINAAKSTSSDSYESTEENLACQIIETEMLDRLILSDMIEEIENSLSEDAYKIFQELWEPSTETFTLAKNEYMRKEAIKSQGKDARGLTEIKITKKHIKQSLQIGTTRYYTCLQEVHETIHHILDKYYGG